MPGLALVSNPPPKSWRNPLRVTGPSITFEPFHPTQKLRVNLFNLGTGDGEAPRTNPPATSTVVFNVFTEEARRYRLRPADAVRQAWVDDHLRAGAPVGELSLERSAGWLRSGPWLVKEGAARTNPGYDMGPATASTDWAYRTLELVWQSRQPGSMVYEDQPRELTRPAVRISRKFFVHSHSRIGASGSGTEAKGTTAALRTYERWKQACRLAGLERPDGYDWGHELKAGWFCFDLPLAFDLIWAVLGSPHPLETALAFGGGHGAGRDRELSLLGSAAERLKGKAPRPTELELERELELAPRGSARSRFLGRALKTRRLSPASTIESEIERARAWYDPDPAARRPEFVSHRSSFTDEVIAARARAVRQGADPDTVAPVPSGEGSKERGQFGGKLARLEAVRPAFEARVAALEAAPAQAMELLPAPLDRQRAPLKLPSGPVHYGRVGEEEDLEPARLPFGQRSDEIPVGFLPPAAPIAPPSWVQITRELLESYGRGRSNKKYGPLKDLAAALGVKNSSSVYMWLKGSPPIPRVQKKLLELYSRRVRPLALAPSRDWRQVVQQATRALGTQGRVAQAVGVKPSYFSLVWKTGRELPESVKAKLLEIVGEPVRNPGHPRGWKRNRDAKWKRPLETKLIPISQLEGNETLAIAQKKYRRFHSTDAGKAVVFRIPDGKKEVTRDPVIRVGLHETLETPYIVPWKNSNKHGDGRKAQVWFHEHPENETDRDPNHVPGTGGRPLEVLHPITGVTEKLGGSYVIDDWWYS